MPRRLFGGLVLLLVLGIAPASWGADLKGSKDHPLLPRYAGSEIVLYSRKAFDLYAAPLAGVIREGDRYRFSKILPLEGSVTRLGYVAPAGRSALEVFRNYEGVLKSKGFTPLFSADGETLGKYDSFGATLVRQYPFYGDPAAPGQRFLLSKLTRPQGDLYVGLYVLDNGFWGDEVKCLKNRAYVLVDVVETKPMETRMVVVKADEMEKRIAEAGRVALYGLFFDTDKTEVKPQSQPTLEEIAKLLKKAPKLRVLVVGHTDGVGDRTYNQDLSRRRAESVAKTLASRYGIAPSRLVPAGAGMLAPVASNRTEEGRAKNRRVELVEF